MTSIKRNKGAGEKEYKRNNNNIFGYGLSTVLKLKLLNRYLENKFLFASEEDVFKNSDTFYSKKLYDDSLHFQFHSKDIKYNVFYFDYGVIVLWGIEDENLRQQILNEAFRFEIDPLPSPVTEEFQFEYNEEFLKIEDDVIYYNTEENSVALAMAHAIAQSIKLSFYEQVVETTIERTQHLPGKLQKLGHIPMSKSKSIQLVGTLFQLRTQVTLVSPVLDTPELFWTEPRLLPYYKKMRTYLDIPKRTNILNRKMNLISDMLEMMNEFLVKNHGEWLEWIVILLVFVSVVMAANKHMLKLNGCFSTVKNVFRVAVVGSGPAGFYTAYKILQNMKNVEVDILEALPIPYGLVRYGVAPDHPEVKAVQHKFDQIAQDERFSFIGNVRLGQEPLTLKNLQEKYHSVILAYGASKDRLLNIPGEQLPGVLSAREFVAWYNGYPGADKFQPKLNESESVCIIGQGNVALDVARVLLSPLDILKKTDMPEYALEHLNKSRVKRVTMVGRRGPVQVSFTTKELRELLNLKLDLDMDKSLIQQQFSLYQNDLKKDRGRNRLLSLLSEAASKEKTGTEKSCQLLFFMSPKEIIGQDKVTGVKFEKTKLNSELQAVGTGETETINCDLVMRSIGYKSVQVPGVPFDERLGRVPNQQGRVTSNGEISKGLYVAGWLKTGPSGIIATTMYDAFQTAECVLSDFKEEKELIPKPSREEIVQWLRQTSTTPPVTFQDWKMIEEEEKRRGSVLGKPQEKFTDTKAILDFIQNLHHQQKNSGFK